MTTDDIFGQLTEETSRQLENLESLEPGTEKHTKAVESVAVLCKLMNDMARISIEGEDKDAQREMERIRMEKELELKEKQINADALQREKELELKEKQMNADALHRATELNLEQQKLNVEIDHYTQEIEVRKEELRFEKRLRKIQLMIETGEFFTQMFQYGRCFKRGLIFEEKGSFSSLTVRNHLSRMFGSKKK